MEFMLTLDKLLNIMALMCISLKSVGRAFRKLFKYLILYAQFSISGVLVQWSGRPVRSNGELYAYAAGCPYYIWASTYASLRVLVAFLTDEGPGKPVQTHISL